MSGWNNRWSDDIPSDPLLNHTDDDAGFGVARHLAAYQTQADVVNAALRLVPPQETYSEDED